MKLEHKVAMGLLGLVAMVGGVFYFANQPKKPNTGVALDKPTTITPPTKTVGDKTVTGAPTASNRPAAPAVPAAKPAAAGNAPKDPSLASNSGVRSEPQLPPVTVAPPARREGTISTDSTRPNLGHGSDSSQTPIGNSPTAGNSSPAPSNPTPTPTATPSNAGAPAGPSNNSTPGLTGPVSANVEADKSKLPPVGSPLDGLKPKSGAEKPDGPALAGNTTRKPISESEIERDADAPPIAELGKKPPANSGTPLVGSKPVPGETTLTPTGSKSKDNKTGRPEFAGKSDHGGNSIKLGDGEAYTIKPGDRLATIAKQRYGNESYVKQILEMNPGLNPDRIVAGKSITLPKKEASTPANYPTPLTANPIDSKKSEATPADPKKSSTGDPNGNGKSDLARSSTGKPESAKPGEKPVKPADEKSVKRNDDPAGKLVDTGTENYVVKKGDTLRKIAKSKLGNENAWTEIFRLNKDKLKNQDGLSIGMSLRLPAVKKSASANP